MKIKKSGEIIPKIVEVWYRTSNAWLRIWIQQKISAVGKENNDVKIKGFVSLKPCWT